jgi:DNA polymerase-3 subunit epsilon
MLSRLSLRLRVFLFFALLMAGAVVALAMGLWLGFERLGRPDTLNAFVQGGIIAGFVILGLIAWVWFLFDTHVAKPIEVLAGALRARAHSDVTGGVDAAVARYLGDLAPAASAAAQSLAETRSALAEAVARETERLAREKAQLERILSDVPVGVVLCTGTHALAFYNGQAVDFMAPGRAARLDRPLFDFLREGPVRLAHERLIATGDAGAATDLLCTTVAGARVLAARMRLLPGTGAVPGYVLTLRDMTADLAAHARREALLAEVMERARRPAANLSMLLEAAPDGTLGPARIEGALRAEVARLAEAVTALARRHDDGRAEGQPQTLTRASDLTEGLKARLEADGIALEVRAADLLLRCNGFEIIALLAGLAAEVAGDGAGEGAGGPRALILTVEEEDSSAMLRLGWQGAPVGIGRLDRWLDAPLEPGLPEHARRAVLTAHGTELWPEARGGLAWLCLPILQARRVTQRPKPLDRGLVYDFTLLSRARTEGVAGARLSDLTFVVFDTETTGLLPQQGDEIVQIAAVRIVNGRRVAGEVFDMLVNPGRTIPLSSTEVHGITDAMVAEAPGVAEAVARFHAFAEGAVLVAHNAPFDMQFLRRREGAGGIAFDHPILDTVLLSAVVYGQHEVHSLDALCHRLGITIPEEARHTAIGDTVATAEAFLKLVAMLEGRGIATFAQVLEEVRKHGRLLRDLN